jgi:hypothetical protein
MNDSNAGRPNTAGTTSAKAPRRRTQSTAASRPVSGNYGAKSNYKPPEGDL